MTHCTGVNEPTQWAWQLRVRVFLSASKAVKAQLFLSGHLLFWLAVRETVVSVGVHTVTLSWCSTPLANHSAWLVSELHLQRKDVTQTRKKAEEFFLPWFRTQFSGSLEVVPHACLSVQSEMKWCSVWLSFHHLSFQCWRVHVAVCHTLPWISPLGLRIFEAQQCSRFVHECTGMQLQKSFTRWNVALAFFLSSKDLYQNTILCKVWPALI